MKTGNLRNGFVIALTVFVSIHFPLLASIIDETNSTEQIGFNLKDLKICHQSEWRNLTTNIEFETKANSVLSDVNAVKNFVKKFFEDYPTPTDFWEIMNTKLVHAISLEFPEIHTMKSTISLAPDRTLSFPRKSTVTYSKNSEVLKESFSFTKLNYTICSPTFDSLDLYVKFDINDNPDQFDYPDYQWVHAAIEEFFKSNPVSVSKWKTLKPQLQDFLLERFPTLNSIDVDITTAH